ncbi:MAG: hypothetical protein MJE12_26225, partial [Alphaproteobacteria bacterium]|nr:hypothetical protein [Alphaproteobacteria bacterium]
WNNGSHVARANNSHLGRTGKQVFNQINAYTELSNLKDLKLDSTVTFSRLHRGNSRPACA